MTVETTISRAGPYAGAGTVGPFPVPFRFLENGHLRLLKTNVATGAVSTLVLDTDYTVVGAGNDTGAVTLANILAAGYTLTILRNVPATQEADYVENDPFPAESHEMALDKLTMLVQQQGEVQSRALVVPATDPVASRELPSASARARRYLSFNDLGEPVATTFDIDAISQASQAAIDAAGRAANSEADAEAAAATAVERAEFVKHTVDGVTPTVVRFSGTGAQTEFTLPSFPGVAENTMVDISGVVQHLDTYTVDGDKLTFNTAPPVGTENIQVRIAPNVALAIGTASGISINDDGTIRSLDSYVKETRSDVEALKRVVVSVEAAGGKEGEDCTAAFNAAIAVLRAVGSGTLHCRLRNYKISAPVTLYDNITVDLHNGSPEFVGTGAFVSALYNAARTSAAPANPSDLYYNYAASLAAGNPVPAITANAMRGASSIKVDNAAGLLAGDYIYVSNGYCDMWRVMEQYTGSTQNWVRDDVDLWRCEIVQIKSITGNVLTLEDRLKNDYPVTVKTYGFFSDENALDHYLPWNHAHVERLGGARNVKLMNAQAINSKSTGEAVTAFLCVGFETENFDVVSATASGIHYYTCLDSHMLRNRTDTMGFSQSIRRGSSGCTMQSPRGVGRANDCPLIIWEGANDCHGSNIRVMGSGVEVAHTKIGIYINACWDCSADGVYAENVRSAAMIGFCRGNTHIRNITGRNVDTLCSVFRSFDWSIEGGSQSGCYTTAYTEYTERLCNASESHHGRIANLKDQDAYSASASGRLHLYKSFGIKLDDIYAPNVDLSSLVADDVLILLDEPKFEASNLTMRNARTAQTYAKSIAVNVRSFKVRKSQFMQEADVNAIHNADFDETVLYGRDVAGATLKLGISHYVRFTNGRILGSAGIDFRALGAGVGSEGHTSLIIFDGSTNEASAALVNYADPSYAAFTGVMSTYGVGVSHVSTLSWLPLLGRLEGSGKSAAGWVKNNTAPATVSTTTAALSSAANPINAAYVNKWIGREVFNATTELFMKAVGNAATDYWVQSSGGGGATITPV